MRHQRSSPWTDDGLPVFYATLRTNFRHWPQCSSFEAFPVMQSCCIIWDNLVNDLVASVICVDEFRLFQRNSWQILLPCLQGCSRIPIYDGERSNIVGILFVKDLILVSLGRQDGRTQSSCGVVRLTEQQEWQCGETVMCSTLSLGWHRPPMRNRIWRQMWPELVTFRI